MTILLLVLPAAAHAQQEAEAPPQAVIGYPNVAAALAALRADPDTRLSVQGGWTIAENKRTLTLWSFAPPDNPSYPSVIRRQVVQEGDAISIRTRLVCEAAKAACDKLAADVRALNDQTKAKVRRDR